MEIFQKFLERQSSSTRKKPLKPFFLAHKGDIELALEQGLSRWHIWDALHSEGVFTGSYRMFCIYIERYIHKAPSLLQKTKANIVSPTKRPKHSEPKSFDWSPNYDKKRLIGD